jgi:hypothetical protein
LAGVVFALAVVSACASTGTTTASIDASTSPTASTVLASPSTAVAPPTAQPATSVPTSPASPPAASPRAAVGPDYRIDATVGWIHFTAQKCGSPSGTWDLAVDGVRDLGGARLVLSGAGTVDLDAATLNGTWEADYRIDVEGIPSAIGGQEAGLTGQASLADATLSIYSQVGTGDFWAQTPAAALAGAVDDPRKDFQLPVQSGQFC